MEGLVKSAGLLYFRVFKHQTVDYFNSSINVFWNTPVMAPALFFYSENDALCDYKSLEKMVEFWRSRGQTVESKMWKESVHAGHLRTHPQDYLSTLEYFVQSLNMVPLKAKMWILKAVTRLSKHPSCLKCLILLLHWHSHALCSSCTLVLQNLTVSQTSSLCWNIYVTRCNPFQPKIHTQSRKRIGALFEDCCTGMLGMCNTLYNLLICDQ